MTKFIPGPWHKKHDRQIMAGDRHVATAHIWHGIWDVNEANAYLIAAAPELFEALERIATGMWHTRACAALIEPESEEPCYCDQEIAKAAIEKAKGITALPAIKED